MGEFFILLLIVWLLLKLIIFFKTMYDYKCFEKANKPIHDYNKASASNKFSLKNTSNKNQNINVTIDGGVPPFNNLFDELVIAPGVLSQYSYEEIWNNRTPDDADVIYDEDILALAQDEILRQNEVEQSYI